MDFPIARPPLFFAEYSSLYQRDLASPHRPGRQAGRIKGDLQTKSLSNRIAVGAKSITQALVSVGAGALGRGPLKTAAALAPPLVPLFPPFCYRGGAPCIAFRRVGACQRGRAHAQGFPSPARSFCSSCYSVSAPESPTIPLSERLPHAVLFALSFSPSQFADLFISAHCPIMRLLQTKSPGRCSVTELTYPTASTRRGKSSITPRPRASIRPSWFTSRRAGGVLMSVDT